MGDLQSMGSDGVVELKGGVVAGSGGSQAQDNACLCWERTRAQPLGFETRGLPSLFSARRISGLSVLELTLCLSPTVPPSLLTSPQTACNGWVLWVTPSIGGLCEDEWNEPALSDPCVLCQQIWRMLGLVGLRSSPGL